MNDPGLITLVNKLQDVFTTVGVSIFKRARRGRMLRADMTCDRYKTL